MMFMLGVLLLDLTLFDVLSPFGDEGSGTGITDFIRQ